MFAYLLFPLLLRTHTCILASLFQTTDNRMGTNNVVDLNSVLDFTNMASMLSQQMGIQVSEQCLQDVASENLRIKDQLSGQEVTVVNRSASATFLSAITDNQDYEKSTTAAPADLEKGKTHTTNHTSAAQPTFAPPSASALHPISATVQQQERIDPMNTSESSTTTDQSYLKANTTAGSASAAKLAGMFPKIDEFDSLDTNKLMTHHSYSIGKSSTAAPVASELTTIMWSQDVSVPALVSTASSAAPAGPVSTTAAPPGPLSTTAAPPSLVSYRQHCSTTLYYILIL